MTTITKCTTVACGAVLALAGILASAVGHAQMPPKPGGAAMQGGMDMKAMMKDNNDKMSSMKMTGNSDVDFAMMMRIHHLGAIQMAEAELRDGKEAQFQMDRGLLKIPAGADSLRQCAEACR